MSICSEHEMRFWMDIHGELDPEDRRVWEAHIAICQSCRDEKGLALQMLGQIKDVLTPKPLSKLTQDAMIQQLSEKLIKDNVPSPLPKSRWFIPGAFIPVAVASCVLLVVVGFLSLKSFIRNPDSTGTPVAGMTEQLQTQDFEIIEYIEMLLDFDTIEQLVQMDDDQNNAPKMDEQTQGKIESGRNSIYGQAISEMPESA